MQGLLGLGWGQEFLRTPLEWTTGKLGFIFSLKKGKSPKQAFKDAAPPPPGLGEDSSALEKESEKTKIGVDRTVPQPPKCGSHTPPCPRFGASLLRRGLALAHNELTRILAATNYVPPEVRTSGASS